MIRWKRLLVRIRRIGAGAIATVLSFVLLVVAAAWFVTRTGEGQRVLTDLAIRSIREGIDGSLEIRAIRSPNLLRGGVLEGVVLRDRSGRSLAELDSIRFGIPVLRPLLLARLTIAPVHLHGLRLSARPAAGSTPGQGWGALDLVQVLRGRGGAAAPGPAASPGGGMAIRIEDLALSGGEFDLVVPEGALSGLAPWLPVEGPQGGGSGAGGARDPEGFRSIDLSISELRVPELILRERGGGRGIGVSRLEGRIRLVGGEFRVEGLSGSAATSPRETRIDLDRLRLPGSMLSGTLRFRPGSGGIEWEGGVALEALALRDLAGLRPDLPDGVVEGRFDGTGSQGRTRMRIRGGELRLGEGRLRGEGSFAWGGSGTPVEVERFALEARAFPTAPIGTWMGREWPAGSLMGRVEGEGAPDRVRVQGDVRLLRPDRSRLDARLSGSVGLRGGVTFSALQVGIESADPAAALAGWIELPPVPGPVRGEIRMDGRLADALRIAGSLEQPASGSVPARLEWMGEIHSVTGGRGWSGTVRAFDLSPGLFFPSSAGPRWAGSLDGAFRGSGGPSGAALEGTVSSEGGSVDLRFRTAPGAEGDGFVARGEFRDFAVDRLLPDVPAGTVLSGTVDMVRDGDPEARVALTLLPSAWAGIGLEGGGVRLSLSGEALDFDSIDVRSRALRMTGGGRIALTGGIAAPLADLPPEPRPDLARSPLELPPSGGRPLQLRFRSEDLQELRPLLLPGGVLARDDLSPLEEAGLRARGIDPDTLPLRAEIALGGGVDAVLRVEGSLADPWVSGIARVDSIAWRTGRLAAGTLAFGGRIRGVAGSALHAQMDAEGLSWGDRSWREIEAFLSLDSGGSGTGILRLAGQLPGEEVRLRAPLVWRDGVGTADLERFEVGLAEEFWEIDSPARLRWSREEVRVDSFSLARRGSAGFRLRVDGALPLGGRAGDLRLSGEEWDLARIAGLLQVDSDVAGILNRTELRWVGRGTEARVVGGISGTGIRWGPTLLDQVRVDAEQDGAGIRIQTRIAREGVPILRSEIELPAPRGGVSGARFSRDAPLSGWIELDRFPAGVALSGVDALEVVSGTLSGRLDLSGTLGDPAPTGALDLQGGAATVEEVGIRYSGATLHAELRPDRTVRVEGRVGAGGEARVSGTIGLERISDPSFDLELRATNFRAAARRDLDAVVGGEVRLGGSWRSPRVSGTLRVQRGTLELDELVRQSTVVDLTDPAFFDVVDPTLVAVRPILEANQIPFLQNLRIDVALELDRDFWLRSTELDLELSGGLVLVFDRPTREVVLVGELQAVRGSYNGFGRRFEIREGRVDFAGTPGIDPGLDVLAETRLRTQDRALAIAARLQGTLLRPRVTLSSDSEPPLPPSELASYLIFGRPSSFLSQGERSALQGATGAVQSLGLGIWANQLGSAVAREVGLDYLSITPGVEAGAFGASGGLMGSVAATQFELGQYIAEDIFLAVVLRPLSGVGGGAAAGRFSGARVEWRYSDLWTLEAFLEDRFSQVGLSGFRELGFTSAKAAGFLLYRDWGY